jgi:hypothetical protein
VLMDCARYHGRKVPTSVVRDNIVSIDSHMQCLLCIWHRRPLSLHLGCVVDWVNLRWEGRADTDCQGGQNLAAFSNMFFVSSVTWRWRQVYSDSKSTPKKPGLPSNLNTHSITLKVWLKRLVPKKLNLNKTPYYKKGGVV